MTQRAVTLGDGRRIGLGAYVKAWRRVCEVSPQHRFSSSLCERWPASASEVRRQFRRGMHDRINRHIPGFNQGRKWSPDWQRVTHFTAHQLNTPRLIIHWLPAHLKARFAHRIWTEDC